MQSFDYKTLEKATCGFKDSNLIGRGGFGFVYKACFSNHTLAAVKRIENVSQEAKREFQVTKAKSPSSFNFQVRVFLIQESDSDSIILR